MEQRKIFKITMVFDDNSNCKTIRQAKDAKTALGLFLEDPSVKNTN